jgi:ribosomal subunit interface protein
MQINLRANNIELTDKTRDYVQKKMDMLEKFLGKIQLVNADVELAMTTKHHVKGEIFKTEINLEVPGELLRVEKIEKDLFKSVDKAKDHMALIISKYKEKKISKKRQG